MLDLVKASNDPSEIAFKPTRIDEVLLDARLLVQKANLDYKVDIHFENDFEDDNQISVNGNEYLLKVAFTKLFENGCKFSEDNSCKVSIAFNSAEIIQSDAKIVKSPSFIMLRFQDKGTGISPED